MGGRLSRFLKPLTLQGRSSVSAAPGGEPIGVNQMVATLPDAERERLESVEPVTLEVEAVLYRW